MVHELVQERRLERLPQLKSIQNQPQPKRVRKTRIQSGCGGRKIQPKEDKNQ